MPIVLALVILAILAFAVYPQAALDAGNQAVKSAVAAVAQR